MSAPVSRARVIGAILKKDFLEFTRDRVYLVLSIVALVMFVAIFWILPDTVDETITLGLTHSDMDVIVEEFQAGEAEAEGLDLVVFASEDEMREVIAGNAEAWRTDAGDIVIRDLAADDARPEDAERVPVGLGIAFPDGFMASTATGQRTTVRLYSDAGVPPELRGAISSFVREIAYAISGSELPVTEPAEESIILGADRMGDQISMRERMRPMLAFFVLMMEALSLASLISAEVAHRTVTAIMVTPARLSDFLAAKSIHGTMLAFSQAIILLAAVRAFTATNWSVLIAAALVGAVMFTGVAMIAGAAGKDFLGTLFYSMAFILPLAVPAFAALFPGTAAAWVTFVPTYGLMETLVGVTAYGYGWSDAAGTLGIAVAWLVVIYGLGLLTLKRKVGSL